MGGWYRNSLLLLRIDSPWLLLLVLGVDALAFFLSTKGQEKVAMGGHQRVPSH